MWCNSWPWIPLIPWFWSGSWCWSRGKVCRAGRSSPPRWGSPGPLRPARSSRFPLQHTTLHQLIKLVRVKWKSICVWLLIFYRINQAESVMLSLALLRKKSHCTFVHFKFKSVNPYICIILADYDQISSIFNLTLALRDI